MSAGCGSLAGAELALPIGAAAPALAELRAERLAALAGPVRSGWGLPPQDLLRPDKVCVFENPELRLAFGGRQLPHGRGEVLVAYQHLDARRLEQVLGVVH